MRRFGATRPWLIVPAVLALGATASGDEAKGGNDRGAPHDPLPVAPRLEDPPAILRGVALRHGLKRDPTEWVSVYVTLQGPPVLEVLDRRQPPGSAKNVAIARRHLALLQAQHAQARNRIERVGGQVVAELSRLTNTLQVRVPSNLTDHLARLPEVVRVEPVPYYRRALASAVPFIGAPNVWQAAVPTTGEAIRIGIVDTGIDYTHADFGGDGDPALYKSNDRTIIEEGTFPTAKVVGGRDFVGDDYDGNNTPKPDPDPLDCTQEQQPYIAGGHGSHVAGIAAGLGVNLDGTPYTGTYQASLNPSSFRIYPGVAPGALLYALKVFGCDGGTTMVAPALEWAADPNRDGDPSDHLDVLNLSLSGAYGLSTTTDAQLVKNVTAAGVLLVIAAGNDGDVFFVTGEPATHTEALAVAATTDQLSYLAMKVDAPSAIAGNVRCAEGALTAPLAQVGPITGALVSANPTDACAELTNASALAGRIALIERGSCFFVDKIQRAADAGALGVIVANNSDTEPPFAMGGDGSQKPIPGVMISKADADSIRQYLPQGVTVTLDAANVFQSNQGADQMADFSSRGPRASDGLLKPDLAAPGVSILSAGVGSGADPRDSSGTSMACPVAAGAAALLRQLHPQLTPLQIKAMLMNTTAPLANSAGNPTPVSLAGAGRVRVDDASVRAVTVAASEPQGAISVSFGSVVTSEPAARTRDVVVSNHGDEAATFEVSVAETYALTGVTVAVSPNSVTVPAQGQSTLTVTLQVDPAALPVEQPDPHTPAELDMGSAAYPRHFLTEAGGHVVLTEPGATADQALRVPYHAVVRAADQREAQAPTTCAGAGAPLLLAMDGSQTHREPVVSAFELATTSPRNTVVNPSDRMRDLLAVGVATNTATAESFADASVYFGLAVDGEWTTPAQGPLSVVGVMIDINADESPDYVVYAEPLSREYFADVLAVRTYSVATGEPVGNPRFLNLVPRDRYNTEPFFNSVVVLPVSLSGLQELTEDSATFSFYGFTQRMTFPSTADRTEWVIYDPVHPRIDTARGGVDGIPFYQGSTPVQAFVNETPGQQPPAVLLLHHTNEFGKRMQIVELDDSTLVAPADLSVRQAAPDTVVAGTATSWTVVVENRGGATASAVALEIGMEGDATVSSLTTNRGECATEGALRCDLGDLEVGASATVSIEVTAAERAFDVSATAKDRFECELEPMDNEDTAHVEVVTGAGGAPDAGAAPLAIDAYTPGGGCSCRTSPNASGPWSAASLATLLALLLRRRRLPRRANG